MNKTILTPSSLVGVIKYFSDEDVALNFVAHLRWPDGEAACPECGCVETSFLSTRRIWKCKACKKQFSVKLGTIFEDSAISLGKWLPALWLLVNAKNGISSYELARSIGVTQKSAWFMLHRIRLAMQSRTFKKFKGEVEVDETFIGGKARNMHKDKRRRTIKARGGIGKTVVMGLLERQGKGKHSIVKAGVVTNTKRSNLQARIRANVEPGSAVHTDEFKSYIGLDKDYAHKVINHAVCYARGNVHTNGLENFWSLLKRTIKGSYVSVEPFHLFRYLDEQVYRFNNRKTKDVARFIDAMRSIVGKRLTYDDLTGVTRPA